jgi:hypothetical protein
MKLKIQFPVVLIALAGARVSSGVISAGYLKKRFCQKNTIGGYHRAITHSHVIPNQPTAKNELKTNRKTAATMP